MILKEGIFTGFTTLCRLRRTLCKGSEGSSHVFPLKHVSPTDIRQRFAHGNITVSIIPKHPNYCEIFILHT
jgi:hypothetical protein